MAPLCSSLHRRTETMPWLISSSATRPTSTTPDRYLTTSIHPPTHAPVRPAVHPSIHLPIHTSVRLSVRPSIHPPTAPFIHLSMRRRICFWKMLIQKDWWCVQFHGCRDESHSIVCREMSYCLLSSLFLSLCLAFCVLSE